MRCARWLLRPQRSFSSSRRCCKRKLGGIAAEQVENAGSVPEDPDLITTEDSRLQQPPASPLLLPRDNGRLIFPAPKLGVNRAYDLALEVIRKDAKEKVRLGKIAEARLAGALAHEPHNRSKIEGLRERFEELMVLSEINDPETRWRFEHGEIDMSRPVHRYMAEKQWRALPLPRLMQRLQQMEVFPDTIAAFEPTVDVGVAFGDHILEPGAFLTTDVSAEAPRLSIQTFRDAGDTRYTCILADPDTPDIERDTFKTTLHWLINDVQVSLTEPTVSISTANTVVSYLPPMPPKGTPYHRYALLVFSQPSSSSSPPLASADRGTHTEIERSGFDVRAYVRQHRLSPAGASLWRAIWDEHVPSIRERLGLGPGKEYHRM